MTSTSISAPAAHTFDPAEWLSRFESFGGSYAMRDGQLALFIAIFGQTDAHVSEARQMINSVGPHEQTALEQHLLNGVEGFTVESWLADFIAEGGSVTAIEGRPALGYPEEHSIKLSNMRQRLSADQADQLRAHLREFVRMRFGVEA